jgi:hypothetical protein
MLKAKPMKNNIVDSIELNQRMNQTLILSSRQIGCNGSSVEEYQFKQIFELGIF